MRDPHDQMLMPNPVKRRIGDRIRLYVWSAAGTVMQVLMCADQPLALFYYG